MVWSEDIVNNSKTDNLVIELEESKTSSSIKENTKTILNGAEKLKEQAKNKNPKLFTKFKKEYEDVRNAIIIALKQEKANIKLELWSLKWEILHVDENLSKWEIDENELWAISLEFWEFNEKILGILDWEKENILKFDFINKNRTKEELKYFLNKKWVKFNEVEKFLLKKWNEDKLKIIVEKWIFEIWWVCPIDNWKAWKERYISNEKSKVLKNLEPLKIGWKYLNENWKEVDINNIFDSNTCSPIDLVKKLEWITWANWEKLSNDEIKKVLDWTFIIKWENAKKSLDDILKKYKLDDIDFEGLTKKEIRKILKDKKINNEDIDKVIKNLHNLKKIKKSKKALSKVDNMNDYSKTLDNLKTMDEIEKYLKENSDKFYSVIKRYNLAFYWNDITDVLTDSSLYFALKALNNDPITKNDDDFKNLWIVVREHFKVNLDVKIKQWEELSDINKDIYKEQKEQENKEKLEYESSKITYDKNSEIYLDKKYWIEVDNIPEKTWKNIDISINNETYNISQKEYKTIFWENKNNEKYVKNPEALKNLVDFKQKMDDLNLWFVWNFRGTLIKAMNNLDWTSWIEVFDNDFINKSELQKLLNFILKIIGEEPINNLNSIYQKIINLNWWIFNGSKKDTISWLSNIWKMFREKWILNSSWGIDIFWYSKLIDKQKWWKVNK